MMLEKGGQSSWAKNRGKSHLSAKRTGLLDVAAVVLCHD
jgi:hypothetical protein